jgi:3',5'-cyclic AMP phosphodiesterase CpdA
LRTVAHLSDLHFGRVDRAIVRGLIAKLHELNPDLVVVSGDLTQRAKDSEFRDARKFLDELPHPQLIVPGNHDVPLYDFLARWLTPFKKFRRYVCEDLEPVFADSEIVVVGINSARSNTFKNGRINRAQIERACQQLNECTGGQTRIVVVHHPFHASDDSDRSKLIRRAKMAMEAFARSKVDLILSGHLHRSSAVDGAESYREYERAVVLAQAGTAVSMRRRGELNAFNLVHVSAQRMIIERFEWAEKHKAFAMAGANEFSRKGVNWSRALKGDQLGWS